MLNFVSVLTPSITQVEFRDLVVDAPEATEQVSAFLDIPQDELVLMVSALKLPGANQTASTTVPAAGAPAKTAEAGSTASATALATTTNTATATTAVSSEGVMVTSKAQQVAEATPTAPLPPAAVVASQGKGEGLGAAAVAPSPSLPEGPPGEPKKMVHNLIIHVGLPKSGTTAVHFGLTELGVSGPASQPTSHSRPRHATPS